MGAFFIRGRARWTKTTEERNNHNNNDNNDNYKIQKATANATAATAARVNPETTKQRQKPAATSNPPNQTWDPPKIRTRIYTFPSRQSNQTGTYCIGNNKRRNQYQHRYQRQQHHPSAEPSSPTIVFLLAGIPSDRLRMIRNKTVTYAPRSLPYRRDRSASRRVRRSIPSGGAIDPTISKSSYRRGRETRGGRRQREGIGTNTKTEKMTPACASRGLAASFGSAVGDESTGGDGIVVVVAGGGGRGARGRPGRRAVRRRAARLNNAPPHRRERWGEPRRSTGGIRRCRRRPPRSTTGKRRRRRRRMQEGML